MLDWNIYIRVADHIRCTHCDRPFIEHFGFGGECWVSGAKVCDGFRTPLRCTILGFLRSHYRRWKGVPL